MKPCEVPSCLRSREKIKVRRETGKSSCPMVAGEGVMLASGEGKWKEGGVYYSCAFSRNKMSTTNVSELGYLFHDKSSLHIIA